MLLAMTHSTAAATRHTPRQQPEQIVAAGARATTRAARRDAVERAVRVMHERFAEPLAHEQMAQAALLSQYHFNRVFRLVTGVSPGRFLTAVRMAEAKRLLLTTRMLVTEVCFAVGFESLGTFTTRFGQFVGLAPQQLRSLIEVHGDSSLELLVTTDEPKSGSGLRGRLEAPAGVDCFALVGLFPTALPQCLPTACTAVWAPGSFAIEPVKRGVYSVFALGFPMARTVLDAMLSDSSRLLVSRWHRPVCVADGEPQGTMVLRMHPPSAIDPPVVLAAPLLAASAQYGRTERRPVLV
jgi:AraC family transcriptional regulator